MYVLNKAEILNTESRTKTFAIQKPKVHVASIWPLPEQGQKPVNSGEWPIADSQWQAVKT